jgi:putative ABC transport system permease protein
MKTLDIIKQANSNLLRNKIRTFLTVIAIFVGSFTIILNTAISTGVNSFIDRQVESFGGENLIQIMPDTIMRQMQNLTGNNTIQEYKPGENTRQDMFLSNEAIEEIKELEHIDASSIRPLRNINVEYIRGEMSDKKYLIRTQTLLSNTVTIDMVAGRNVDSHTDQAEIALAPDYATTLGYTNESIIGQTVYLAVIVRATQDIVEVPVTVVGVQAPGIVSMGASWISGALSDQLFENNIKGLTPEHQARLSLPIGVSAEFNHKADENAKETKKSLEEMGLAATTIADQVGQIKDFFDVIIIVFNIFGIIALVAASIGIINTLFMAVQERTREIGLMKAMGLSSAKVFLSFSIEAISLGFWGSALGITVSIVAGSIANEVARSTFLSAFPTFNLTEFTVFNCVFLAAIIMFIAFLAGTLPARRAAHQNPIDALRYE